MNKAFVNLILEIRAVKAEKEQDMNNIGHLNGNWKNGDRPTLDDAAFQFTNLEWAQVKLNIANEFICKPHFPAMVERGKALAAEVVADVMAMLAAERDAETPALYVPLAKFMDAR